jgi:hypothetical protein
LKALYLQVIRLKPLPPNLHSCGAQALKSAPLYNPVYHGGFGNAAFRAFKRWKEIAARRAKLTVFSAVMPYRGKARAI